MVHRLNPPILALMTQYGLRIRSIILLLLLFQPAGCGHGSSDIDDYIGALERPGRDEYQRPAEVIDTLSLKEGMAVADLGAGSGYFTRRLSKAVGPSGKVFAIDIDQRLLDYNQAHFSSQGIPGNTQFILAKPDDALLPPKSADMIFLCNVYHHIDHPVSYFLKVKSSLAPGGRLVIIDFYHDERSGKLGFSKHHLVPRERVLDEMGQVGFHLIREHGFLPRQYFLEFSLQQ